MFDYCASHSLLITVGWWSCKSANILAKIRNGVTLTLGYVFSMELF
jgi:hypothetical protein